MHHSFYRTISYNCLIINHTHILSAAPFIFLPIKAAVKVLSDGLRMDLVDTPLRVTNVKPGLVETNFSVTRFGGDKERADKVYQGIKPLTGDDIADVVYYAASAPEHVQIAEVLVLATHQASGSLVYRKG